MTVGDIYGNQSYVGANLSKAMIGSSFAKVKDMDQNQLNSLHSEDVARSLLTMVFTNAQRMSAMLAQTYGVRRVVWIGLDCEMPEYCLMA